MDVIRAYLADPVPITLGVLPKVPLATQTVLQYALGISETSKQWSIRLEVTAKMMRAFIQSNPPPSISTQQKFSLTGFPITKKQWISDITFQPPKEDDIRQALFAAIEGLANHDGRFIEPEIAPVTGEWTGYCVSGCSKNGMTERQKYQGMMSEAMSRITVLYFHGGAYYLMDPATHRPTVAKIAKYTKGRVLSIRYRLAPKYPFPSALLDALLAYLTLLYPPPGSFHEPIPADQIVFAGDSSGGNLCLSLLQTLLEFKRQSLTPLFNGRCVSIPLPCGLAANSPWCDVTRSMPSCEANANYDYIPSPSTHPDGMKFPKCELWPADPPRKNFYAEDNMLCHPLVSPLAAKDWRGSPPLWICTGQELLTDEDRLIASKFAKQGIPVLYTEWECMPHCFAMIVMNSVPSKKCFQSMALFITLCAKAPRYIETKGVKVKARSWREEGLDVESVGVYSDEQVEKWMRKRVEVEVVEGESGADGLLV